MEKLAYRPTEAAAAIGVHVQTVRALVESGRLVAVRVGRRIVIPKASIDKFLAAEGEPTARRGRR